MNCTTCAKLSPESERPTCRECLQSICKSCEVPGSLEEHDYDRSTEDGTFAEHTEDVLCKRCRPCCPACGLDTIHFVTSGCFVECTNEACYWTQTPDEDHLIAAGLATYKRDKELNAAADAARAYARDKEATK